MLSGQAGSSAVPVIAQWAHKQSDHGGSNEGYGWAQQYGLPLTIDGLAIAA